MREISKQQEAWVAVEDYGFKALCHSLMDTVFSLSAVHEKRHILESMENVQAQTYDIKGATAIL